MWIVLHSIFWDGNAVTEKDVMDSLKSPGVRIELEGNLTDNTGDPARSSNIVHNVYPVYPFNKEAKQTVQEKRILQYNNNAPKYTSHVRRVPMKERGQNTNNRIQDRISIDSFDTLVEVS